MFSASSKLVGDDQSFWTLFGPGLAANVGYWITLSMNIPDFTRYAKDQRSQIVGQSIAMPLTMTGFSFIGIAVTCGDDGRLRRGDLGSGRRSSRSCWTTCRSC